MDDETITAICISILHALVVVFAICLYCCRTHSARVSLSSPSSAPPPAAPVVANTTQTPLLTPGPDTIQLIRNTERNRSGDIITRLSAVENKVEELYVTNGILIEEIAKIKKKHLYVY